MHIRPEIFKAYDIRGKYPREISEVTAERIGSAAARYLGAKARRKRPNILVCRDIRLSSPILMDALSKGILSEGVNILQGGIGTTPFFYFLMNKIKPDGGIMVTASHSPAEYNGFKIQNRDLRAVSLGSGLEVIQKYVKKYGGKPKSTLLGEVTPLPDFSEDYLSFLSEGTAIQKQLKVVIDAAGGAETLFLPKLLSRFPKLMYKPLFFEPDGSFRNHSPNPLLPEAQQYIGSEMKKSDFNFGVLFDGDSDRILFFDEKGSPIRSDFIFALLAEKVLKKKRGALFAATLNISKGVREYIEEKGGRVRLSPQGYPYLQERMRRWNALIGVEMSGHFHFEKTFFRDSALLPFLLLAEFLSESNQPLSRLVAHVRRYAGSNEIAFPTEDKKGVIDRVRKAYEKKAKLSFLDGITVEFPDWWFNIRQSNPDPVVRLVIEADTEELLQQKKSEIEKLLR